MGAVEERVEAALAAATRDDLNAFITVAGDGARAAARRLDGLPEAERGALHGVLVSVKDNLAFAGLPLTCGSRHLEAYVAPYTATVVSRLEAAGAVVVGKTNLDEFGCGSSGENSAFGATLNPRDRTRVPGGSSSGAAASVGGSVVDLAIGSDTGGSIRCPAAYCGMTALKPSYGRVSRFGMSDLAMGLESPAPLARSVAEVAAAFRVMAGADPRDAATHASASAPRPASPSTDDAADASGLRIGVVDEFFDGIEEAVERPVRDALSALVAAGASVTAASVPSVKDALPTYYLLNYGEFASAMQRFDGFRYGTPGDGRDAVTAATAARASLGPEVKRRVLLGTFITSREEKARWFDRAAAARARLRADFARAFSDVDVLVGPTMPTVAFRIGERVADPLQLYASDVLTVSANLAGLPAGSVPLDVAGLPVGLQVLGPPGQDERVLDAMRVVETLAGGAS